MAKHPAPEVIPGRLYFAFAGWTIAVILAVTFLGGLSRRSWDTMLTWQVIALLVTTAAVAGSALPLRFPMLARRRGALQAGISFTSPKSQFFNWLTVRNTLFIVIDEARVASGAARLRISLAWAASALYVIAALTLITDSHRRFVIVIGLLEACGIYALRRPANPMAFVALSLLAVTTWGLSSGLTYTNLGDWILNSTLSGFAVVAFVFSMGLVLSELCDDRIEASALAAPRGALAAVFLIFAAFCLRSDNLLNSWVPYHRSFVADVAQAVRDGHWLLWDVPSVYGFLSILSVAVVPAKNGWQALFILTSAILVVQSCIIFALWRWGRRGSKNFAFALLITLASFGDSIARYPWSARLYPQGALRFVWVLGLLLTVFLIYVWREYRRRLRPLFWVGHGIWLVSLLWSFESAVWATAVWVPYTILWTLILGGDESVAKRLAIQLWPLAALPIAATVVVESIYVFALGHGPDLFGYVEFTGLFVSGTVHAAFPTNPAGAGWCIVLVLSAVGSVVIAAIRDNRRAVIPLLVATWLAVWATSTYYAVEPFDGHVPLLLDIMLPAAAILTFVSRDTFPGNSTALFARLSAAPIAVICIAFFLGEPSRFGAMKFPFMSGWTSDTLDSLPAISGELRQLTSAAGIRPGDRVLIPNRQYWTEISQGMLFPLSRTAARGTISYRAWAPLSPLGIQQSIMGLSSERRQVYIERYLDRSRVGGWYVEYRAPAVCEQISTKLMTTRTLRSPNYTASLCEFVPGNHHGSPQRANR